VASQLAIENSVSALIMAGSSALKRAEEKAKVRCKERKAGLHNCPEPEDALG